MHCVRFNGILSTYELIGSSPEQTTVTLGLLCFYVEVGAWIWWHQLEDKEEDRGINGRWCWLTKFENLHGCGLSQMEITDEGQICLVTPKLPVVWVCWGIQLVAICNLTARCH